MERTQVKNNKSNKDNLVKEEELLDILSYMLKEEMTCACTENLLLYDSCEDSKNESE